MKFKSSYEVIELIEQKKRNGIALRQLKAFMESVGNPQLQLKCIHVGGTNGKGSTVSALSSVLQKAGYRVGTFTSPYLITHHDRIRVNGKYIEDEVIVNYANQYYDTWVQYDLSMFEIDMYIATQYFIDQKVDIAVYEVGMGGIQDATNVIYPMISCITNIGLDHMEYLGNTYEEIALTKAGIIKENSMFITNETKQNCMDVFKKVCEEKHCTMIETMKPANIKVDTCLHFDVGNYKNIMVPTLAKYQSENISFAISILDILRKKECISFTDEQLYEGIANFNWQGRFEIIRKDPLLILDGAHNNEGMDALVDSIKDIKDLRILFSALGDKPHDDMLKKLLSVTKDVVVTQFDFYRAADAKTLAGDQDVTVIIDFKEAIQTLVKDDKPLLICGSLYFISQVREYLMEIL